MKYCKFLSMALIAVIFAATAAAISPWDAWRLAYTNFELGEEMRDRGDYAKALEAFNKAKEHYNAVRKARPDWNQRVIRERLADCDRSISNINRLMGNTAATATEKPKQTTESEKRQSEITLLQTRLAEATVEIAELKRNAGKKRDFESEIALLLRDQRIAGEKYALLESRFKQLQATSKQPDDQLRRLQERLVAERMNSDLAAKKLKIANDTISRNERELLRLRHASGKWEKEIDQLRAAEERLRKETAELRRQNRELAANGGGSQQYMDELQQRVRRLQEENLTLSKIKSAALTAPGEEGAANAGGADISRLQLLLQAAEHRSRDFQQEAVRLRNEYAAAIKRLQLSEATRLQLEKDKAKLEIESGEQKNALQLTTGELKQLRETSARMEQDFRTATAARDELEIRLKKRESDDFKSLTAARDSRRRLEAEINALQDKLAEQKGINSGNRDRITKLEARLKEAVERNRKTQVALTAANGQLTAAAADAAKYRELAPVHARLERNFAALQKENRENKLAADAAKPREAELARIKLRLAELDTLKSKLAREQQLTEELNALTRRQEAELQSLRQVENKLAAANRKLASFSALEAEVRSLRKLSAELTRQRSGSGDSEDLEIRRKLIEAESAQLELFDLKKRFAVLQQQLTTLQQQKGQQMLPSDAPGSEVVRKQAVELAKLRKDLILSRSRIAELETLVPQIEKLKKFNSELLYARNFETELNEAKLKLTEMARLHDELARTSKLNTELLDAKQELEKELARRPRISFDEPSLNIPVVNANLREKPGDYIAAARLAVADDSPELAVWNYRKALELDPEEKEALQELGMLLLKQEEYDEAVRHLAAARAKDPDNVPLTLAAARANIAVGRYGNAKAILIPLQKSHGKLTELRTLLALATAGSGDEKKAEAIMRLAVSGDANAVEPVLELARLIYRSNAARREEALQWYEKARMMGTGPDLELEPVLGPMLDKRRDVENFLTEAAAEAAVSGDYQAVTWYCRRLIELNRAPERFVPRLAFAQFKQGQAAAARETLTFHKTTAMGMLVSGLLELNDNDPGAAILAARRAVALNGGKPLEIPYDWKDLGIEIAKLSGKSTDAVRALQKACRINAK